MAHFWTLQTVNSDGRWEAQALPSAGATVTSNPDGLLIRSPVDEPSSDTHAFAVLAPTGTGTRPSWTLMTDSRTDVRINGRPQALGLCVLHDQDEILLGSHRMFFSTEELARVVAFPGFAQPAFCPRCKQKIEPGDPAVCCPHCRAWSHQSEALPCWTYEATCALCQTQSTALDAGFNFNPAIL